MFVPGPISQLGFVAQFAFGAFAAEKSLAKKAVVIFNPPRIERAMVHVVFCHQIDTRLFRNVYEFLGGEKLQVTFSTHGEGWRSAFVLQYLEITLVIQDTGSVRVES